jgi:CheY-like chemotaxis protein
VAKVILIVDDEPLILDLTSAMLEDLGCEVLSAGNGNAALACLADDPRIDLMITDIQVPGMSGYELAAKVRERWPEVQIVVTSGNDLGGKGYAVVRKPFSQPQLEKIIGGSGLQANKTDDR